jgi:hypothetical protein
MSDPTKGTSTTGTMNVPSSSPGQMSVPSSAEPADPRPWGVWWLARWCGDSFRTEAEAIAHDALLATLPEADWPCRG